MTKIPLNKFFLFREDHFIDSSLFLLLSVIFEQTEGSKIAWQPLRHQVKEDSLSSDNYKVFSILVSRLCQLGIQDELMPKLKGLSRYIWVKNQTKVKIISELIKQLKTEKINFVVWKEFGFLLSLYQEDIKLPIHNLAFLVDYQDIFKTIDVLTKEGWKPKGFICEALLEEFNFTRLENENVSQDLRIIEVFWRIESKNSYALISSEYLLKQELNVIEFKHHLVNVLNSTYQLYYLLSILGDNINLTSWSVNFIQLLRNESNSINWDQLSDLLQKSNLHITLKKFEIYSFLKSLEQFHKNQKVLETLDNIPITLSNKVEFWLQKYKSLNSFFTRLHYRYKQYTKTAIYQRNESKLQGFGVYLKQEWRLNSYRELPLQMIIRSAKYWKNLIRG